MKPDWYICPTIASVISKSRFIVSPAVAPCVSMLSNSIWLKSVELITFTKALHTPPVASFSAFTPPQSLTVATKDILYVPTISVVM